MLFNATQSMPDYILINLTIENGHIKFYMELLNSTHSLGEIKPGIAIFHKLFSSTCM